jgi:hypothetical protein
MSRAFYPAVCLLTLVGCQLPPEQVPLKPLPEDGPAQAYADLLNRARVQAASANEAFYVNRWADLEDAAKGLEQTAAYLAKAADIPAKHKDSLPGEVSNLVKDTKLLREAAKTQNVGQANEILQRINFKVRELRPEN